MHSHNVRARSASLPLPSELALRANEWPRLHLSEPPWRLRELLYDEHIGSDSASEDAEAPDITAFLELVDRGRWPSGPAQAQEVLAVCLHYDEDRLLEYISDQLPQGAWRSVTVNVTQKCWPCVAERLRNGAAGGVEQLELSLNGAWATVALEALDGLRAGAEVSGLKSLSLWDLPRKLTGAMQKIIHIVQYSPSLRELHLNEFDLEIPASQVPLEPARICRLSLDSCHGLNAAAIAWLANMPAHIHIARTTLDDATASALAACLRANRGLQTLDLQLSKVRLEVVAKALQQSQAPVSTLRLEMAPNSDATEFLRWAETAQPRELAVVLDCCADGAALATRLQRATGLKRLELGFSGRHDSLRALWQPLCRLVGLKHLVVRVGGGILELGGQPVAHGIRKLLQALPRLRTLQVGVRGGVIEPQALQICVEPIQLHQQLTRFAFSPDLSFRTPLGGALEMRAQVSAALGRNWQFAQAPYKRMRAATYLAFLQQIDPRVDAGIAREFASQTYDERLLFLKLARLNRTIRQAGLAAALRGR